MRRPRKRLVGILIGLIVLLAAAGYVFNILVIQAPQRVFWDALANGMNLQGVDCTVAKPPASGQSSRQSLWLDLSGKKSTRVSTTLTQNGTKVTTEDINTPAADYIRYTAISTNTKDKNGKGPDVSKLLNVWAKQPRYDQAAPTMLGKVAMGGCIVPLADLSGAQVQKLAAVLKTGKVFQTNFAQSRWHWQLLHPYRDYTVKVASEQYITFMKQVDDAYGTKALAAVSAADYAGKPAQTLKFRIGAEDHRIQSIAYADGHETFTFSHYDERPDVAAPAKAISIADLQQRLQAIR